MHPRRLRCSSLAYDEYAALLAPRARGVSALRCRAGGSGSLFQQEVGGGPSPAFWGRPTWPQASIC